MKKGADSDMIVTSGYRQFIGDLKARVTAARLSTARHINRDLINLYWDIGQSIDQKQAVMGWGESVVEVIARDLSAAFPGTTGLSPQNVWRMLRLYRTYTDAQFISQLVREANRQCLDARGPVGLGAVEPEAGLRDSRRPHTRQGIRGQGGRKALSSSRQRSGWASELDACDDDRRAGGGAARVTLCSGDVLMTEGGDLDKLGRGTVRNGEIPDCLHQNHIFAIRCFKHKLLPEFLAYLTASRYGRDYFEATGKRTTNLASTNSTKVGLFPIPRPSIDEQRAICAFLDEKLDRIGRIVRSIESQIDTLGAYRKSLIHECVTGRRRITAADVEPLKVWVAGGPD